MSDLARMPSGSGCTYHLTAPCDTYLREIAAILEALVPGLKVGFEPDVKRADLPTASKIFDKAITDLRAYFDAEIHFDRTNTDRDLSPGVKESPLDLAPFCGEPVAGGAGADGAEEVGRNRTAEAAYRLVR